MKKVQAILHKYQRSLEPMSRKINHPLDFVKNETFCFLAIVRTIC